MKRPTHLNYLSRSEFVVRTLIVATIAGGMAGIWILSDIFLLVFGAVLVAIVLRSIADPINRSLNVGGPLALLFTVLLFLIVICGAFSLLGPSIAEQVRELTTRLPTAFDALASYLQAGSLEEMLKGGDTASSIGKILLRLFAWGSTILAAIASATLVIFGGLYLAADSRPYLDGVVSLFPKSLRPEIAATLTEAGDALKRWLTGQLFAMVLVGLLTGLGLWLANVPSPIALGLIAGLAEFVPIFGPFVALIPALLMASSESPTTLLWAAGIFVIVQQFESNAIAPLIAKRTVAVAPALGLFAVVSMGVLFGPLGILFGFPLVVVADVAVRRLYIRNALEATLAGLLAILILVLPATETPQDDKSQDG